MNFFEHPAAHFIFEISTLSVGVAIIFTIATFYLANFKDKSLWAFYTISSALASIIIALILYSWVVASYYGYGNTFKVLRMITGSFVFIGLYVLAFLSKPHTSTYQTERANFQNFFVTLYDYRTINIFLSVVLGLFVLFFMANLFYRTGIKLSDELGYIDELSCHHRLIVPQIGWANRFFPFAHQEFNFLSHIFNKLGCSYYFLYSITFAQGLLTLFLLYKIIPFQQFWQKILTVLFIACQSFFIIPMIILLIPERNLLFLSALMLYAIIRFYQKQQTALLILALFIANIMLYFKEPVFIFLAGFALTSLIVRMIADKISIRFMITKPISFIRQNPLEIGMLFLAAGFVLIYGIYTLMIGGLNETSYGNSGRNIFMILKDVLMHYPFLVLFFIMPILYLSDYRNLSKHQFSLMLYGGALLYAIAIISLRLHISGYYYSLAHLGLILSICFYVQTQKQLIKKLKQPLKYLLIILLVILLAVNFIFVVKQTDRKLRGSHLTKEQISQQKVAVADALSASKSQPVKIFIHNYKNRYNFNVTSALIERANDKKIPIIFYHYAICEDDPWPKGSACPRTDNPVFEDYDIVIFYQTAIPTDEWQALQAQYGERLKLITHFPKYLRAGEHYNVYMLQNHVN